MGLLTQNQNDLDLDLKLINYVFCHNETLFLDLAKQSQYLVIKLTNDMRLQYINEVAQMTFGWLASKAIGSDYNLLCKNSGFKSPLEDYLDLINKHIPIKFEACVLHSNGEKRHLQMAINFINNEFKKTEIILIVGKDVTEKRRLEEKENAVGIYLKQIFLHLPVAVWWKDGNSVFQGCNEFCSKVAGLSSVDEIIGKTDFELAWHKDEAEAFRNDDQEVMMSAKPKLGIIEKQHQSHGKCVTLFTSKIPICDPLNNVVGTTGFFCDISVSTSANLIHLSNTTLEKMYDSFKNDKNYYFTHNNKVIELKKREAECLTYLSMGKTVKEIARLIGCSPRTIEDYINALKLKLNGNTKSDLAKYFWTNPIKWF